MKCISLQDIERVIARMQERRQAMLHYMDIMSDKAIPSTPEREALAQEFSHCALEIENCINDVNYLKARLETGEMEK